MLPQQSVESSKHLERVVAQAHDHGVRPLSLYGRAPRENLEVCIARATRSCSRAAAREHEVDDDQTELMSRRLAIAGPSRCLNIAVLIHGSK